MCCGLTGVRSNDTSNARSASQTALAITAGGALFEEMTYDGEGQPLTSTFVDYLLPTICPSTSIGLTTTPQSCTTA